MVKAPAKLGYIFNAGSLKVPEDSYLVIFLEGICAVQVAQESSLEYRDEEKTKFTIAQLETFDKCDPIFMELIINKKPIDNVIWFSAARSGDEFNLTELKYSRIRVLELKFILSWLPIFGGVIYYLNQKRIRKMAARLRRLQHECADHEAFRRQTKRLEELLRRQLRGLNELFPNDEDMQEAERLKIQHGSWEAIGKNQDRYQELSGKIARLGEDNLSIAVQMVEDMGNLKNVERKLQDYENTQNQLQTYRYKLNSLGGEPGLEAALRLRSHGSYEDILESIQSWKMDERKLQNLKQTYGSLDSIKEDLSNFTSIMDEKLEIEMAKQLKNRYGSFNEIVMSSSGLSLSEMKNLSMVKGYCAGFDFSVDEAQSYGELINKYRGAESAIRTIETLSNGSGYGEKASQLLNLFPNDEDVRIAERLKSDYSSWPVIEENQSRYSEWKEKVSRLGEDNLAIAVQMVDEMGNLKKAEERLRDYDNLRNELQQYRYKLDSIGGNPGLEAALRLKPHGSYDDILESIQSWKLDERKLQELKNSYGNLDNIKNYLSAFEDESEIIHVKNLKSRYSDLKTIDENLAYISLEDIQNFSNLKKHCPNFDFSLGSLKGYSRLQGEYGGSEQILKRLESSHLLDLFTSDEDVRIARKLMSSHSSWPAIEQSQSKYLELREKVARLGEDNLEIAVQMMDEMGNLRNAEKRLQDYELTQQQLQDYKYKFDSIGGTESELTHIKNLRSRYLSLQTIDENLSQISLQDIQDLTNLKKYCPDFNYSMDEIKSYNKLLGEYGGIRAVDRKISQLETESSQQKAILENNERSTKEREERWIALSDGKSLEQLEQIKRETQEKNPLELGRELEEKVEYMLDELKSDYATDDSFEIFKQPGKGDGRLDFLLKFKNQHNQELQVVIECKAQKVAFQMTDEIEEGKKLREVEKWLQQTCQYCSEYSSPWGIIVTNSRIYNLDKNGIRRVPYKEIPEKYRKTYGMNIFLVHESFLKPLIFTIKLIHAKYEPPTPVIDIFEKKRSFADQKLENVSEGFLHFLEQSDKLFTKIKGGTATIATKIRTTNRTLEEWQKDAEALRKKIHDYISTYNFYSEKPLLEGSVSLETTAEEDEEKEES